MSRAGNISAELSVLITLGLTVMSSILAFGTAAEGAIATRAGGQSESESAGAAITDTVQLPKLGSTWQAMFGVARPFVGLGHSASFAPVPGHGFDGLLGGGDMGAGGLVHGTRTAIEPDPIHLGEPDPPPIGTAMKDAAERVGDGPERTIDAPAPEGSMERAERGDAEDVPGVHVPSLAERAFTSMIDLRKSLLAAQQSTAKTRANVSKAIKGDPVPSMVQYLAHLSSRSAGLRAAIEIRRMIESTGQYQADLHALQTLSAELEGGRAADSVSTRAEGARVKRASEVPALPALDDDTLRLVVGYALERAADDFAHWAKEVDNVRQLEDVKTAKKAHEAARKSVFPTSLRAAIGEVVLSALDADHAGLLQQAKALREEAKSLYGGPPRETPFIHEAKAEEAARASAR